MTGTPDRLSGDLGWGLAVLFRAYVKAAEAIADDVPGGHRGYQVLSAAARDEPGSQAAMAQSLGIDRTVMTYLLDDLEAGFSAPSAAASGSASASKPFTPRAGALTGPLTPGETPPYDIEAT